MSYVPHSYDNVGADRCGVCGGDYSDPAHDRVGAAAHKADRVRVWDWRFARLAVEVSSWSKDPRTRVGAVIVDEQRRVVSTGYNGFPRGVEDLPERYADKSQKYPMIVHAEANAILTAGRDLRDCVLYATKSPCSECVKLVIQSGVARVVSPEPDVGGVWGADAAIASLMMREAGVGLTRVAESIVSPSSDRVAGMLALLARTEVGSADLADEMINKLSVDDALVLRTLVGRLLKQFDEARAGGSR